MEIDKKTSETSKFNGSVTVFAKLIKHGIHNLEFIKLSRVKISFVKETNRQTENKTFLSTSFKYRPI